VLLAMMSTPTPSLERNKNTKKNFTQKTAYSEEG